MKNLMIALVISCVPVTVLAPSAEAQFGFGGVVYDPANHAQNILTAVRSLQEINQQIQQLAHEIEILENMAKDLESLPTSIADEIRDKLLTVDRLIQIAEGISYQVDEVETEYEVIYRKTYGTHPPSTPILVQEARIAWEQSRAGYKHALQVQAQVVSNIRGSVDRLHGLVGDSQGAEGNLAVLQAGNQIAALSAEQIMQIQTLLAAQYRADALEQSRELAERERGRARLNRFLSGGSAYTPGGSP